MKVYEMFLYNKQELREKHKGKRKTPKATHVKSREEIKMIVDRSKRH